MTDRTGMTDQNSVTHEAVTERPALTKRVGIALARAIALGRDRLSAAESSTVLLFIIIVIIVTFWILLRDTAFMTFGNLMNIVRQTTEVSVMAVVTVFVISAGEIDLSVASIPPLSGLVAALLLRAGYGTIPAVALALASGAVIGLLNGLITVRLRMPSFIVTLGMTTIVEGAARWITFRESVPVTNPTFTFIFGSSKIGPVPILLIWTLGVALAGYIVLRWTPWGKAVLATGANEAAAHFSGIRTNRVKLAILVMSGVSGALAGLLYSGHLPAARYDLGAGELLTVLAAVIIGGTALAGGRGSVMGAVAGSWLMGIINNGLIVLGFDTPQQLIFRGAIIVMAVALSARAGA